MKLRQSSRIFLKLISYFSACFVQLDSGAKKRALFLCKSHKNRPNACFFMSFAFSENFFVPLFKIYPDFFMLQAFRSLLAASASSFSASISALSFISSSSSASHGCSERLIRSSSWRCLTRFFATRSMAAE